MSPDQAVLFLEAIQTKNVWNKGNGWVVASCPLARWLHQNKSDSTPSFGLLAKTGEASHYHCFACGSGSPESLLHTLIMYTQQSGMEGYNFKAAHAILSAEELEVLPLPEYAETKQSSKVFQEWPKYWIDSFVPVGFVASASEYLAGRGVSLETIEKHNLRFDSHRQMIVCPYYTVFGKLAGARGRSILPDATGGDKHYDYKWQEVSNAKLVWYNEQALQLPGPGVVVEGQFDCWRVELRWPKVVANMTALPWIEKMRRLSDMESGVHIPDTDATGQKSAVEYQSMAAQVGLQLKTLKLPDGVKDPDECHPDFLFDRIQELISH